MIKARRPFGMHDPETELPEGRKSRNSVKETFVPTPRTPTSVRKHQMQNQGKMKLGISPISRKIGNYLRKPILNLNAGKVGKLKQMFEGTSVLGEKRSGLILLVRIYMLHRTS